MQHVTMVFGHYCLELTSDDINATIIYYNSMKRALFQKLIVNQPDKKVPQSIPYHDTVFILKYILILFCHVSVVNPRGLFPSDFHVKIV